MTFLEIRMKRLCIAGPFVLDSYYGEIKMALRNKISVGPNFVPELNSSSLKRTWLTSSVLNSNFFTSEFPLYLGQRQHKINTKKLKKRISRYDLALKYQKMVNNSKIGSRAALARKLGVSRAWVTVVMRELE